MPTVLLRPSGVPPSPHIGPCEDNTRPLGRDTVRGWAAQVGSGETLRENYSKLI